jgi:hypothetical protein
LSDFGCIVFIVSLLELSNQSKQAQLLRHRYYEMPVRSHIQSARIIAVVKHFEIELMFQMIGQVNHNDVAIKRIELAQFGGDVSKGLRSPGQSRKSSYVLLNFNRLRPV